MRNGVTDAWSAVEPTVLMLDFELTSSRIIVPTSKLLLYVLLQLGTTSCLRGALRNQFACSCRVDLRPRQDISVA